MMKDFLFFGVFKSKATATILALSALITTYPILVSAKDTTHNSTVFTKEIASTKLASKANKYKDTSINFFGKWEAKLRRNRYQMKISWNSEKSRYEGRLFKQGLLSKDVGFKKNEVILQVYAETKNKLVGSQVLKTGRNGKTTNTQTVDAEIYLDKDTPDKFMMHLFNNRGSVTFRIPFERVK